MGLEPTTCGLQNRGADAAKADKQDTYHETAKGLAPALRKRHPELVRVVEDWPRLPEAVKAGILAMVEAAGGG